MRYYHMSITVTEEHLDEREHVNNVVFVQWVQEVAKAHWFSLAQEPFTKSHFWVVVKHELEYKRQAFLGDRIVATTYVENVKGPFSIRCVEFKRGEELLVSTRTTWCLLDAATQKPKRVPEEIVRLFVG